MIEYKIEQVLTLREDYLNDKVKLGYKLISVLENKEDGYFDYKIIWSVEDGKIEESE